MDIRKFSLRPYKRPLGRFKNGRIKLPSKTKYKWFTEPHTLYYEEKLGEYQPIKLTKFEGTDNQIRVWLKRLYNFEFKTYTAKGTVKVDRDELDILGDAGEDLRTSLKLKKDLSQLGGTDNSLIESYRKSSGSIHGRVDTIGAATHRCTHSTPNLAQIPAVKEFRELFTAPPGYVLVGADLANIEIRVLAHYLAPYDNGEYAKMVLSKDMHFYHSKLSGFWTEDDREWPSDEEDHLRTKEMKQARIKAKGFFFAFLYSAGDTVRGNTLWTEGCLDEYTPEEYASAKKRVEARIMLIEGKPFFPLKKSEYVEYNETLILKTIYGKRIADTFKKNLKGLNELIEDCQNQSKTKGTVTAIDGRELYSRSPHSALNLLLQGSAGVIAKQWMVNYHDLASQYGLTNGRGKDFYQQAYIHDEFQVACIEGPIKIDLLKKALTRGASMVTQQFNTAIPIRADATYGKSWHETH